MKKKIFIIGAMVIVLAAVICFIFLPTEGMRLSEARELKLNNKFEEAFKIYQELSEDGSAEGTYYLANSYGAGKGVEQSDSIAWKYYQQAAQLGNDDAKAQIACAYIYGWYNQKKNQRKGFDSLKELYESSESDYVKARYASLYYNNDEFIKDDKEKYDEIMGTLTESTDPYVLRLVGCMYESGEKTDGDKAIEYWTKAYESGDGFSAYNLARVYLYGWFNKKIDEKKGIEWLKKGIERLSTDCMLKYGDICMDDSKENKEYYNTSLGLAMYKKAARQNVGDAYDRLGAAYTLGNGVEMDTKQGFEYFEQATELRSTNGTYNCAVSYLTGRGCSQDVKKAEKLMQLAEDRGSSQAAAWLADLAINNNLGEAAVRKHLEKAVSLGNTDAFYFMALCYQSGWWSYPQDSQNAFSYFKKAADDGHIEACKRVAELYRTGNGCQMDLKRAKEYENKAKEQN